jgi:hypothetical protein
MLLAETTWAEIEVMRDEIARARHEHVADAAQGFVDAFCARCPSVVLARMFLVLPFDALPEPESDFARRFVNADPRLLPSTRVLSLGMSRPTRGGSVRRRTWRFRCSTVSSCVASR